MDLKGYYANLKTTKTIDSLAGLDESNAFPRRPAEPFDTHIRLTGNQIEWTCEAFLAGDTMTEIGIRYGVDRTTVRRFLMAADFLR